MIYLSTMMIAHSYVKQLEGIWVSGVNCCCMNRHVCRFSNHVRSCQTMVNHDKSCKHVKIFQITSNHVKSCQIMSWLFSANHWATIRTRTLETALGDRQQWPLGGLVAPPSSSWGSPWLGKPPYVSVKSCIVMVIVIHRTFGYREQ